MNDLTWVENFIRCNLCSNFYDDPRLLPCFHTYCFRCINTISSINQQNFSCPSCKRNDIDRKDLQDLPSNPILKDIIQAYESIKTPLICSYCEESSSEYICNDCAFNQNQNPIPYCSDCYQIVHRKGIFQKHSKIRVNDQSSKILFCSKHFDERVKRWCNQCHTPICNECQLNDHSNHSSSPIQQKSNEFEKTMKIELEYLQSSLEKDKLESEELKRKIAKKCEMNKREVMNAMKYLRDLLDEHEKQMYEEIENFHREEMKEMEEYQMKLNNFFNNFHLQNHSFQFFLQTNDQFNLLKNQIHFSNYLSQTKDQFNRIQIPHGIDYQINGLEYQHRIKELILQYAVIQEKTNLSSQIQQSDYSKEDLDLTEQDFHSAIEIVKKNSNLVTLCYSDNQMNCEQIEEFLHVLKDAKNLTTIEFSRNNIGDEGMKSITNFLRTNETLTTIYLDGNAIGQQGIQYLSDILRINEKLTTIDLRSNQISSIGAKYLVNGLTNNKTLTTLYLSNNRIGNEGVLYLSQLIQRNSTLMILCLEDNQINNETRRRVIEMEKSNEKLVIHW